MTSDTTTKCICSQGSPVGLWLYNSRGLTRCPECGVSVVPVSRFRAREQDKELPIDDTCGLLFTSSSPNYDLQCALENRLRAILDVNGSPECDMTWANWDMRAGLPICRLRASAHRTSDNDSGSPHTTSPTHPASNDDGRDPMIGSVHCEDNGHEQTRTWPTATASDGRVYSQEALDDFLETGTVGVSHCQDLDMAAQMTCWPTPDAGVFNLNDLNFHERVNRHAREKGYTPFSPTLQVAAQMTLWPTTNAIPESRGGLQTNPEAAMRRKQHGHQVNLDDAAAMTLWGTPTANDGSDAKQDHDRAQLKHQVHNVLTPWGTPTARDGKDGPKTLESSPVASRLPRQSLLIEQTSSVSSTELSGESRQSRGSLNPVFSTWLMGFSMDWLMSLQKSRRKPLKE